MQAEDRSRAPAYRSYWGRSTLASVAMHAALVSIGVAVPIVWSESRPAQSSATVWANFERAEPYLFDERPEPELTIEEAPHLLEHPMTAPIPVEPDPFPELDPSSPLEPVDWATDGMRRASLEPMFALVVEPVEAPVVETVAMAPTHGNDLAPLPVEVAAHALADHCPTPIYPRRARRMGWHGTVVCSLTVGADGLVRAVFVLQSSGHELLDETVLRTLNEWRFAPATRDGVPTGAQLIRRFRFDLPS